MTDTSQTFPHPITLLAVREIIADCVGVDLAEVTSTANFFDDLGGESIDVIDLAFRFEKAFHVKAPFKALTRDELWARDASGHLTPTAIGLIRQELPFLNIEALERERGSFKATSLLTAEWMYQMLIHVERD